MRSSRPEVEEMMHRYFPDQYPDPKKKTEGKNMPKPKRVGTADRDLYAGHISMAFGAGYMDENEMQDRTSAATKAVVKADLDSLVEDLPSLPELNGEKITPKKVRQWGFGLNGMVKLFGDNGHPVLAPFITLVLGLVVSIVPTVLLAQSWIGKLALTQASIALLAVLGASMVILGIGRLMWQMAEGM